MMHKAWRSKDEVPYCFLSSSIKFQGYMGKKIDDLIPILSKITRPVAAIKSLRFALFKVILQISKSPILTRFELFRTVIPVRIHRWLWKDAKNWSMMTSSNGNIFRVTGPLCGEFTGHRWHRALMFSLICTCMNDWVNNCEAGDLRRHHAHYDVSVMVV